MLATLDDSSDTVAEEAVAEAVSPVVVVLGTELLDSPVDAVVAAEAGPVVIESTLTDVVLASLLDDGTEPVACDEELDAVGKDAVLPEGTLLVDEEPDEARVADSDVEAAVAAEAEMPIPGIPDWTEVASEDVDVVAEDTDVLDPGMLD